MAEASPEMGSGGSSERVPSGRGAGLMPSQMPPSTVRSGVSADRSAAMMAGMGASAPSLPVTQASGTGITAWQNNKQITALWSINENRNAWAGVDGIGWQKLANNFDSVIVALTMLCAHAREKASMVNYREEGDGIIHELYVW